MWVIAQYLMISGSIAALFLGLGIWAEQEEHRKLSYFMTMLALVVGFPIFLLLGTIEVFVIGFLWLNYMCNRKGK